jgi:sulfite dehydrogenase (cytochrome) subunit B
MQKQILPPAVLSVAIALSMAVGGAAAAPLNYALPEEVAAFRVGEGRDMAQNNCLACHSADYVNTQPPHRAAAFWEAEVMKMIKAYHAPISDADVKAIVDYLTRTY